MTARDDHWEIEEYGADADWRLRAEAVVAGVASTGSKRPMTMFGEEHADAPTHFIKAAGCHVHTAGGSRLVDCTMALGAVAIGYGDDEIVREATERFGAMVAGLTSVDEIDVAERLVATIPCAERVLFFKGGAEAMSAAVRLARTYTGRAHVVGSGYFGWSDWCSDAAGVPDGVRRDFTRVAWGDVDALSAAVDAAGSPLAAIAVEPVVERLPDAAWLATARALADRAGAVLIFDEIKTGFRLHRGGYQAVAGVTPDLATFGKALANGFPLAAVVGRADVMNALGRTWISSTLASEAVSLGAAIGVLDHHEREDVCARLATVGARMRGAVADALAADRVQGIAVAGIDPMWFLHFDDARRESRFLSAARRAGVLFKRGAYDYAALAHDDDAVIHAIGEAAAAGFNAVRELDATGS